MVMTNTTQHWSIGKLTGCQESRDWALTQPTWEAAWANCERGDWMLHYIGRHITEQGGPEHCKLILAVVACGRLALPFAGGQQNKLSVIWNELERWGNGEDVDLDKLARDTEAAGAAAWAAEAARAAAWAAAGAAMLKQCAIEVRRFYPVAPVFTQEEV